MDDKKREIRSFSGAGQPRIREAEGGGESRTITGYAIVFGVESKLLVDWYEAYREIIEPGAVTAEDLLKWDIKMTMWHNREKLLARWNKGEGTLRLSVDEVGVKYEFEAPQTADGNNALELVKRGDMSGSSFIYWADEDHSVNYTKNDEGVIIRHVNKIDMIMDMTIASDPAYAQTTVSAREVAAHGVDIQTDEQKKQQKEQAEQAEKEAKEREARIAREIASVRSFVARNTNYEV